MKTEDEMIEEKIRGNLKFILCKRNYSNGDSNYYIKEVLIKGNGLLNANSILSKEVYDTLKKAKNAWKKI